MEKRSLLMLSVGLVVGVLVTLVFTKSFMKHERAMGSDDLHKRKVQQSVAKTNMMMGMDHAVTELEKLSGSELDMAFLGMMISHHEGAIEMAEEIVDRGSHPELKKLATEIITAQKKEIAQMEAWKTAWNEPAATSSGSQTR